MNMDDESLQASLLRLRQSRQGGIAGPQPPNAAQNGRIQAPGIGQRPNQLIGPGNQQQMSTTLQQKLHAVQQNIRQRLNLSQEVLQEWDQKPYPRSIHGANEFNVPDHVKTWGELKTWLIQNPHALPQDFNIFNLVLLQFQTLRPQQGNSAQMQNNTSMPQSGPSQPGPMMGPGTLNGQQQQQIMQNWQSIPVGPQEILGFRQKDQRAQNVPDETIKQAIQKQKFIFYQKQRSQQQQSQPQQQQHPQQQQLPFGPTSTMQPQLQVPQQIQQAQQRQTLQRPQQRPQSQQAQQRPGMPISNNMAMPTPKGLGPAKPSPTPQPQRGVKRPASEDFMEVPPPNQSPATITQHRAPSATGQRTQTGQQGIMVSDSSQKDTGSKEDVIKQLRELIIESNNSDAVARKPPPGPIQFGIYS